MLDLAKQKGDKEAGLEEPVRYASASIMQNAAEVMAYGTAVKFVD